MGQQTPYEDEAMGMNKRVTRRATYGDAVRWIALNDNAGSGDKVADIAGYISTLLVADLFGAAPDQVALDVANVRSGDQYSRFRVRESKE